MKRGLLAAFVLAYLAMTPATAKPDVNYTLLSFKDLDGWLEDDHSAALSTFQNTCEILKNDPWPSICSLAKSQPNPRIFFELLFRPVLIEDGQPALFTGYFEPELNGARQKSFRYKYPIYRKPPELADGALWYSREEIENQNILAGRGLEIAWVDDPVEIFFLQIQGSGRIRLKDGSVIRVGYGGSNGHSYRSIGEELVRRGIYKAHQVSAQVIQNWVRRNPILGVELLHTNPSYVFFRELPDLAENQGPIGAMNRPITPNRTIAVDPKFTRLGIPVWLEKGGQDGFHRLMVAQDTGSAIKGAQRADIFFGTGDEAGKAAGRLRDPGRMVVLLPIDTAYAKVEGFAP